MVPRHIRPLFLPPSRRSSKLRAAASSSDKQDRRSGQALLLELREKAFGRSVAETPHRSSPWGEDRCALDDGIPNRLLLGQRRKVRAYDFPLRSALCQYERGAAALDFRRAA